MYIYNTYTYTYLLSEGSLESPTRSLSRSLRAHISGGSKSGMKVGGLKDP